MCVLIEPDYVSVRISLQVALVHIEYIYTYINTPPQLASALRPIPSAQASSL